MIKRNLSLKCDLTQNERNQCLDELLNAIKQKEDLIVEKKSKVKEMGLLIKEQDLIINKNSFLLDVDSIEREVECMIKFNKDQNQKTITRIDTGDTWDEEMTTNDHNLFDAENVQS